MKLGKEANRTRLRVGSSVAPVVLMSSQATDPNREQAGESVEMVPQCPTFLPYPKQLKKIMFGGDCKVD